VPAVHVRHAEIDVLPDAAAYLPAPQFEHAAAPCAAYLPGTHSKHFAVGIFMSCVQYPGLHLQSLVLTLPANAVEFGLHVVQLATLVAAITAENVDSGQFTHGPAFVPLLYCPALHAEHGPPFEPKYPGKHKQSVIAVLAAGEVLFSGQAKDAPVPVEPLYHPAGLGEHGPPFGPTYPGKHEQFVTTVLAAGEMLFSGHASDGPVPVEFL